MKVLLRFAVGSERLAAWREKFRDVDFVVCEDEPIPPIHHDAAVLVGGWELGRATADSLSQLRWVQATFTGIEGFRNAGLQARGIPLTNFRGVAAGNIAEHTLAGMLAFARGLPELLRRQARREWRAYGEEPPTFDLTGQVLGLVGLGTLSLKIAEKAKGGFDMTVLAVRRKSGEPVPNCVDRVFATADLREMLRQSDHVVLAAALTDETRFLFDRDMIAAMKTGAYIYNVGRGELVDTDALIAALQSRKLAGAMLDVTHPEPLPADSPLWDMPNVIVTAHTAGPTPHYWDRGYTIFADNLERFLQDRALINVVDLDQGY